MKKMISTTISILFLVFILTACNEHTGTSGSGSGSGSGSASGSASTPPTSSRSVPNIVISNIEIRPNPYHLWPASNFDPGDYTVVVTVKNTGNMETTSPLFFTFKVIKGGQYSAASSSETGVGGATYDGQVLAKETVYVTIRLSEWLMLQTAQGDFETVVGSYKTKLEVASNESVKFSQTVPDPVLQIVKG